MQVYEDNYFKNVQPILFDDEVRVLFLRDVVQSVFKDMTCAQYTPLSTEVLYNVRFESSRCSIFVKRPRAQRTDRTVLHNHGGIAYYKHCTTRGGGYVGGYVAVWRFLKALRDALKKNKTWTIKEKFWRGIEDDLTEFCRAKNILHANEIDPMMHEKMINVIEVPPNVQSAPLGASSCTPPSKRKRNDAHNSDEESAPRDADDSASQVLVQGALNRASEDERVAKYAKACEKNLAKLAKAASEAQKVVHEYARLASTMTSETVRDSLVQNLHTLCASWETSLKFARPPVFIHPGAELPPLPVITMPPPAYPSPLLGMQAEQQHKKL